MNEQDQINHPGIDQRVQYLLNGSIDGELNESELDELDGLLAGSDKLRKLSEELVVVTGLLDGLPEIEPPQYLQESIERQVRLPAQDNRVEPKQGFFRHWLPTHWLQTGFALAAGAVLTIGVYEMGSGPITREDATNLVGTVAKSQAADQGELLDNIPIRSNTLNGRVEFRHLEDFLILDVQLSSAGSSEIVVNLAGQGLEFEDIIRKKDHKDIVSVIDSSIKVTSIGDQNYILKLRRTSVTQQAGPLELEFFIDNTLVHEAELSVPRL